ncbi:MAG: S41 family peptidase [Chlamydiia bacterium]
MVLLKSFILFSLFTINDIPDASNELFKYHYNQNSFDTELSKRSMDLFIESFDLDHSYFLWSEVKPMLSPSGKWVDFTKKSFQDGTFNSFIEIQKYFEQAIDRRVHLENEIIQELSSKPFSEIQAIASKQFEPYPANFSQLKTKIRAEITLFVAKEVSRGSLDYAAVKGKIFTYYQKKQREKEIEYSQRGPTMEEHYFSVHVLKALAASMDAHTRFFSPQEKQEMRQALSKDYSGIGIVLRDSMDGPVIQRIIPNSPAQKGGVQPNDLILAIDGKKVDNLYFKEVIELLSGRVHTKVRLLLLRDGNSIEITVSRASLNPSASSSMVTTFETGSGVIAAIRLDGFYDNDQGSSAAAQVTSAIGSVQKGRKLQAVILDLRRNTGGFLTQAGKVCSIFTGGGPIVLARYGNGQIGVFKEKMTKPVFTGPLIILISRLSASASEIVAQTLKEYGVAIVVGDVSSYGKGSMQFQTITSQDPYCYAVTIAKYYTISGSSVQLRGVQSDVLVPTELSQIPIGEQYLKYPLSYDTLNQSFKQMSSGNKEEVGQIFSFYQKQVDSSSIRSWIPQLKAKSEARGLKVSHEDAALYEAQSIAQDLILLHEGK